MVSPQHPRYESLQRRDVLVEGYKKGIVSIHGLIAQGRGEAFDYLLGEKTSDTALHATKVACAYLLTAQHPVISVNGNTAALVPQEIAELWSLTQIPVEINLFHRSEDRIRRIAEHLHAHGVINVLTGLDAVTLPHVASQRAIVDRHGIFQADTVFVPLEDGDRAGALVQAGTTVLSVDLNPLSRTAQTSTVTIVDEVTRAMKNVNSLIRRFIAKDRTDELEALKRSFSNRANLDASLETLVRHVQSTRT
ncbi:MAG: phosphopantothenate/pantothenate synthetase [Halobacteriota archaeon]